MAQEYVREVDSDSQAVLERVRAIRVQLEELEAELERRETDQIAPTRVAGLDLQSARTERDGLRIHSEVSAVDPAAYEEALAEIRRLRGEVLLYQHDRSLSSEDDHHSFWRFLRRR